VTPNTRKPRLAVVSPFLDKRHGTERAVVEWISQLAPSFEIHIYSQEVQDLDLSLVTWHRIPKLPGPHILNFLWWFAANHLWRAWHGRVRKLRCDLVFTPGINCLDADVISVFIVFAEYIRGIRTQLSFASNSLANWPRIFHRRLYYALCLLLERRTYPHPIVPLVLIARKTGLEIANHYGRQDRVSVVYIGLDHRVFNPLRRNILRDEARERIGASPDRFVLLLVGNDWPNKGGPVLLEALRQLPDLPVDLIVAGREDPSPYLAAIQDAGLDNRIRFLPPRNDIEFYYSAADVYTGPSLEDTFALPPQEAMACGLPVIVSSKNGTSEMITDGVDGLILADPHDSKTLAALIRRLYEDSAFRSRIGQKAAETAQQYTWERSGRELALILEEILRRKESPVAAALAHESGSGGTAVQK
jgi:glycosyltransferase involved in cell wall biosynthesis